MKKKLKLFSVLMVLTACISYAYAWYSDILIPAWQAFVWAWFAFWHDLDSYSREP